jgi:hypothetical protein
MNAEMSAGQPAATVVTDDGGGSSFVFPLRFESMCSVWNSGAEHPFIRLD